MTTIPLMTRLASRLGMLDYPSPRKVHAMPVARVGGVGVAIGALIPIALWAPMNEATQSYLIGSLILLVFGMWDDARDLNPYLKFLGQIIAASAVVYYGDVYVAYLPFAEGNPLPASIAQPFTVFALVGMINATISLYYYLMVIKAAYLVEPETEAPPLVIGLPTRLLNYLLIAVMTYLGVFPQQVMSLAENAVKQLIWGS